MDSSIQLHQKELCNKLWAMANAPCEYGSL